MPTSLFAPDAPDAPGNPPLVADVPAVSRPAQAGPPTTAARTTSTADSWPLALRIVPWVDPLIDRLGHDPRSAYVETFWLGVLGPSATWFLRRAVTWLDEEPDGVELDLEETAAELGLGGRSGRHAPFPKTLDRCILFGMAQRAGGDLAVRRRLPPLSGRHLVRLPPHLQDRHQRWSDQHRRAKAEDTQDRARQLALSLVRLGEDATAIEQQLARWRVHPAAAHDAVSWAMTHEHAAARRA